MWFEKLMGFKEESPAQVRSNITIDGSKLISLVNQREFIHGELEISSLSSLIMQVEFGTINSPIQLSELIGNVQLFHVMSSNEGAMFQAASQFNLLEMISPSVTPENGIDRYEMDRTQGPACAISCGAGTIFRNYFVVLEDQIGQSADLQVDCLSKIGAYFQSNGMPIWTMKNGYALFTSKILDSIDSYLSGIDKDEYEKIKGLLELGIQWNTQVTLEPVDHLVSQIYCSALPVSYNSIGSDNWERFARLILEASYEASFLAAIKNFHKTGNNKLYLTLVGGGAFGNQIHWIIESIEYCIEKYKRSGLNVRIVSYSESNFHVKRLINNLNISGHQ